MIATNNETEEFTLYKRVNNSDYEWEKTPTLSFLGRTASQYEKNNYRLMAGVNTNTDSVYIFASNLPDDVKPFDKVKFGGKVWTVESIGYYLDNNRIINRRIMNPEFIAKKSPKGLTLK